MVLRLSSFNSLSALRAAASRRCLAVGSADSGALHAGQRLAKPGLSGRNSNSSEHMTQVLIGSAIRIHDNAGDSSAGLICFRFFDFSALRGDERVSRLAGICG
jgi:hypothetical protein